MGYTHYWSHHRNILVRDWKEITADITAILNDVQHVQGIALAYECDEAGKQPEISDKLIRFNGIGDDGHETFYIERVRGPHWSGKGKQNGGFTKTARKPYDIAVVACLAYLDSVWPQYFGVSSDGNGSELLEGVELARRVVTRHANVIDIPLDVRKCDRWDWRGRVQMRTQKYDVRKCIDGHWYAFERKNEANSYRFPSEDDARHYLGAFIEPVNYVRGSREGGKSIFDAWGSFDARRTARLVRRQNMAIANLLTWSKNRVAPPAYARPNVMPKVPQEQATLADLYNLVA